MSDTLKEGFKKAFQGYNESFKKIYKVMRDEFNAKKR